ncbi:MAG: hypothetical protein IJ460_04275 [Clostridia bacterium]|nr:hypothetical protein [Clostridia bacterium]
MANQKHVSIRMEAEMLSKFYYVSKYNGRSGSGQIIYLMRTLVEEFEKEHGKITEEQLSELNKD